MLSRLTFALPLAALVCSSGCRSTTSNRVAYSTQPAVVAAVPAPPPACATPVVPPPPAVVVPPPPPGFIR